jgi:concanavalin A-like lectin/glucanase superfamily protein
MKVRKILCVVAVICLCNTNSIGGILQEGKTKVKEGTVKELAEFAGNKNILQFKGDKSSSREELNLPLAAQSAQPGYSCKINFKYQKNGEAGKGNFFEMQTRFWDKSGKTLKIQAQLFRIYSNADSWEKASQEIYIPGNAARTSLILSYKGKGVFSISRWTVSKGAKITNRAKSIRNLMFQENFESFPAIFANGGRIGFPYDTTIADSDMEIVKGKFGKALKIKNNKPGTAIAYSPDGKVNLDEGCIEFWQKIKYKDMDKYPQRALVAFWLNGIGDKTNRIQIFSGFAGKKQFGVRFSGNTPNFFTGYGETPDKWHHVAVSWKANKGRDKDEFTIYKDGEKLKNMTGVTIEFDKSKLKNNNKKVTLKIGGSYKAHGEEIIIDRLRIWGKYMDMTNEEIEK